MSSEAPVPAAAGLPAPAAWFRALRPRQWVKNSVLLAGILFTLDKGHGWDQWLRVLAAIAVFCALSSSIYLVNDVCDAEQDRLHPRKRLRPVAAGLVSPVAALATALLLALCGLAGAAALGGWFIAVAVGYLGLTLVYTTVLKHIVLLDVLALAMCYVLRAVAGAVVVNVEISHWLLICTLFAALLIGLAKRRNELVVLEDAGSHRRILDEYTLPMLDQLLIMVGAGTLIGYVLYTNPQFSRTAQQRPLLMLTIPFVVYGLFRFFYLVHRHGKGGDPSRELLEDRPLLLCTFLWGLAAAAIMLWR